MTQKKLIVSVYVFVCCVVTAMGQSLKYYNADDFPLIGKMSDDTEGRYARLPLSCKGESKKWVWILGQDTPGLAVRFATNSTAIAAKSCKRKRFGNFRKICKKLYFRRTCRYA